MSKKMAAFLDLQGTLGGDEEGDVMDFSFYPFAIDAIKLLNLNDILAIVVTNQSRIAKGYLTCEDYEKRIEVICSTLKDFGAHLDGIYCCPHSKEDNCICKKPLPGLVKQAEIDFDIDLQRSFIIGDMGNSDMALASNIGIGGILVKTGAGIGSLTNYRHVWDGIEPYLVSENVLEAVGHIVTLGGWHRTSL
jgi:histidinol-phosphate phosphatase family protein